MALINQSIQARLYNFNKYICNENHKYFCDNEDMKTYADRLNYALKLADKNQSQLAKAIGVKPQAIQYLCKKGVRSTFTSAIAKYLRVNANWLDTGVGDAIDEYGDIVNLVEEALDDKKIGFYDLDSFLVWDSNTPLGEDEVELPLFKEVKLSAGSGICEVQENHGPKLRFAHSTLRRYGVDETEAACAFADGTSMEPVIRDGSAVGIDKGKTEIKDGNLYAIDHDGHLRIKMIYRVPGGGLRLKSYNSEEYPDEIYKADDASKIKILGFVFWWSVMNKW